MTAADETIWLVELDAWDGTQVQTLRWGSSGYTTRPTEWPPNAYYAPRVQQPALYRRAAWTGPAAPRPATGGGEVHLVNADGALDVLAGYAVDGRALRVLVGARGAAYNTFSIVLAGTVLAPAWEDDLIVLRVRDLQALVDIPLRSAAYGGTNVAPGGIDGTADLAGQPKPAVFGKCLNVATVLVNGSRLIYQVHDGALASIDAVYDRGAALGAGSDYSSQAEMEATAPAAGQFRAWLAGGLVRLGSSPAGQVTVDLAQGATSAARYPGALIAALADRVGFTALDAVALAALDVAAPYECGLVADATETAAAAIDRVCSAAGAWWGFDSLGRITATQLVAPADPVLDITDAELIELSRSALGDGDGGVPVWRTVIGHSPISTVQRTDLAGVVSADRRERLATEYLTATAADASVRTAHLLAAELRIDTPLMSASSASAEAVRRQALHGVRRDRVQASVRLSPARAAQVSVGQCVRVTTARLGYRAGRLLRVVGLERDARIGRLVLELWG